MIFNADEYYDNLLNDYLDSQEEFPDERELETCCECGTIHDVTENRFDEVKPEDVKDHEFAPKTKKPCQDCWEYHEEELIFLIRKMLQL